MLYYSQRWWSGGDLCQVLHLSSLVEWPTTKAMTYNNPAAHLFCPMTKPGDLSIIPQLVCLNQLRNWMAFMLFFHHLAFLQRSVYKVQDLWMDKVVASYPELLLSIDSPLPRHLKCCKSIPLFFSFLLLSSLWHMSLDQAHNYKQWQIAYVAKYMKQQCCLADSFRSH